MTETTAHAPGSVTVLFAPPEDVSAADGSTADAPDDQTTRGVSIATADGVTATVEPADDTRIWLGGDRTSFEPVAGVLDRLDVRATVRLSAAIPVGAGFGASGAATLATALAADEATGGGRSRARLIEASARAEIAAGTGLGDVFVQAGGGMAFNTGDGRQRTYPEETIGYTAHGGIATASVLDDAAAMDRIRAAADRAFPAFDPSGPLAATFDLAREFAEASGLVTDRVRTTLDRVTAAGGSGTMAMVGETVVAVGTPDVCAETTRVAADGARLLSSR